MSNALMTLSPLWCGLSSAALVGSASAIICSLSHAACSTSAVMREGPSVHTSRWRVSHRLCGLECAGVSETGLTETIPARLALAHEVLERGDDVALVRHLVLQAELLEPFQRGGHQLERVFSPANRSKGDEVSD